MNKAVHQLDALSSLAEALGVGPAREDWRRQRRRMEAAKEKHTPRAVKERRHWVAFRWLLALFGVGLRLAGLYERGVSARRSTSRPASGAPGPSAPMSD